VLATAPPTVAIGPFQLSFTPWLKPLLTSLPSIVGDCRGTVANYSNRTFCAKSERGVYDVGDTRPPIVLIDIAHFILITDQLHR